MDAKRTTILLTIIGYPALLLSVASTVCPPAMHLPLIAVSVTALIFSLALFMNLKGLFSGTHSFMFAALLSSLQLLPVVFIIWAISKTPGGSL
jgi:lysylphosphatidylglycerol synthetase-like protein (DUF2156 family)